MTICEEIKMLRHRAETAEGRVKELEEQLNKFRVEKILADVRTPKAREPEFKDKHEADTAYRKLTDPKEMAAFRRQHARILGLESREDLLAEYAKITDPVARARFREQHEKELAG